MKFFYKIPDFLTEISYRYPFTVVLIAFLLAAAGGYIYFFKLPIISDRDQLVSKALETNRIYQEYRDEFGHEQILVLAVKTKNTQAIPNPGQRKQMKLLANHWAEQLRQRPELFPNVWERIESAEWNSLALLYLQLENLQKLGEVLNEHLPKFEEWAHSPSLSKVFALLNQEFKNIGTDTATTNRERISIVLSGLTDFLRWLQKELTDEQSVATNGSNSDFYSFLSQGRFDPDGFIFSRDGRLLTAFATVSANSGQQNRYAEVMEFAEAALKNALAEIPESLGLEAGLAGMPALEYEELKTAHQDFTRSAVIALFCVTLLFVLAFRNFIRPALAAACLCLAIAITFGVVWLTIGHLNLLAMIFTVILVALGIDVADLLIELLVPRSGCEDLCEAIYPYIEGVVRFRIDAIVVHGSNDGLNWRCVRESQYIRAELTEECQQVFCRRLIILSNLRKPQIVKGGAGLLNTQNGDGQHGYQRNQYE
ncbi:MMPL family transporter [candidate division KSB1 bacterium]|nr:MMPL family transporter [candidate division KSB1 bacterium]